jgi:hypothetical protein
VCKNSKKHNYQIENLKNNGDDLWITSSVVVALGACCELKDEIEQLRRVVRHMEAECGGRIRRREPVV